MEPADRLTIGEPPRQLRRSPIMDKLRKSADIGQIVTAILAGAAALWWAAEILAPITAALVAGIILAPVTDFLLRRGVVNTAATILSVLAGVVFVGGVALLFQPVIVQAMDAMPRVWRELNSTIVWLQSELRGIEEMGDQVKDVIAPEQAGANAEQGQESTDVVPSVQDVVVMAPLVLGQVLIFLGTLFFFVLTRRDIYRAAADRLISEGRRAELAERFRAAEIQVSRYIVAITMINAGLGTAVMLVMAAIGLPSPLIWGILAFVLNYVLYLGPVALTIAFGVAGVTVFDGSYAMLPAAAYLALNMTEAQFVTPAVLGRHLSINPLVIFLSLVVFLWLWGPLGAVIAIPLLLWVVVLTQDIRAVRSMCDPETVLLENDGTSSDAAR